MSFDEYDGFDSTKPPKVPIIFLPMKVHIKEAPIYAFMNSIFDMTIICSRMWRAWFNLMPPKRV